MCVFNVDKFLKSPNGIYLRSCRYRMYPESACWSSMEVNCKQPGLWVYFLFINAKCCVSVMASYFRSLVNPRKFNQQNYMHRNFVHFLWMNYQPNYSLQTGIFLCFIIIVTSVCLCFLRRIIVYVGLHTLLSISVIIKGHITENKFSVRHLFKSCLKSWFIFITVRF